MSGDGRIGADTAFGENPVSDFTATWAADRLDLAHAVRRKVVMQHEPFAVLTEQSIDPLLIAHGSESDRAEALRLAPGEQRRAVNAG